MKNRCRIILQLTLAVLVGSIFPTFAQDTGGISAAEVAQRQANIRAYFAKQLASYKDKIVVTKTMPDGQVVDWLPADPNTATPPPINLTPKSIPSNTVESRSWLDKEPSLRGPQGTVPRARFDVEAYLANTPIPPADVNDMFTPPKGYFIAATPGSAGGTYYWVTASINSSSSIGTGAYLNVWYPAYVAQSGDHTLTEIAVTNVSGTTQQTIELGFGENPSLNGSRPNPCIFSFFTTNGYASSGNNVGGYNEIYTGFVPYTGTGASSYYPGASVTTPYSGTGGTQNEVQCDIVITGGNYWLWAGNGWMGYYPASLFGTSGLGYAIASQLAYGEVSHSSPNNVYNGPDATRMGSGVFPGAGFQYDEYVREWGNFTELGFPPFIETIFTPWTSSSFTSISATDTTCYSYVGPYFNGGSGVWDNFYYLGGRGTYSNPNCVP